MKNVFLRISQTPTLLVLSTLLVNVLVILACPTWTVPPPLSKQRLTVVSNATLCLMPLLWTVLLLAWGRGRLALTVALVNLAVALAWLFYAVPLVVRAF
jgi:hypothetical protein